MALMSDPIKIDEFCTVCLCINFEKNVSDTYKNMNLPL